MRLGTGLRLAERGDALDDDLLPVPVPALVGWFALDHWGVDGMLLDATWIEPWASDAPPRLRWGLALRESVWNGMSLRAQVTSEDGIGLPDVGRVGLGYALNRPETWSVRLDGVGRLPDHTGNAPGEWRIEVGLRANLDWHIPVDIDRWPLGHQVGAPGPSLPSVQNRGPNRVTEVVIPPVGEPVEEEPAINRRRDSGM